MAVADWETEMTIKTSVLWAMVERGATAEMIVAAIEADEAEGELRRSSRHKVKNGDEIDLGLLINVGRWSFDEFWKLYPHKIGKQDAHKAFLVLERSETVSFEELMAGLRRYCAKNDERAWCNPATFLRQGRWADEPAFTNVIESSGSNMDLECWIKQDSPEWDAWTKHRGKSFPTDRNGGWLAPSRWPSVADKE